VALEQSTKTNSAVVGVSAGNGTDKQSTKKGQLVQAVEYVYSDAKVAWSKATETDQATGGPDSAEIYQSGVLGADGACE